MIKDQMTCIKISKNSIPDHVKSSVLNLQLPHVNVFIVSSRLGTCD